jgi:hypothetical protein
LKFGDSFLEKAPGVDVTLDSVFAKAENARYFLWDTYGKYTTLYRFTGMTWITR